MSDIGMASSGGVISPCLFCGPGLHERFKYEVCYPFLSIIPFIPLSSPSLASPLSSLFSSNLYHYHLVVEHIFGGSPAVVRLLLNFFAFDGLVS